jgi:hypothetical protein
MTTKVFFTICAVCAFCFNGFAQSSSPFSAPSLTIKVKGDRTTIQTGEQVVLTAKGNNDEVYSLQWQVSTDGTKWRDIPKATGTNLETASLSESQYYRIVGRTNQGFLAVDDISAAQAITIGDNVASTKSRKQ